MTTILNQIFLAAFLITGTPDTSGIQTESIDAREKLTQRVKNSSKRPDGIYRYDRISKKNRLA